ncbi:MAG: hypothetical protein LJE68_04055 [Rhodobacter sp.]|nr:hypothetical protein [Rhodobacter sp.]
MTRNEVEALMPFLANDTLADAERAEVEAAVAADPDLQRELAALRVIRETMQAEEEFSPGEMGLARLMRSVDAETNIAANQPRAPRTWVWQIAASVLLAVVVGQAAFQLGGSDPGGFELAGGDAPAFTIAFNADVAETDLRNLLLDANVEIVSGPSALGLYGLAVLEGTSSEEARALLEASPLVQSLEVADEP